MTSQNSPVAIRGYRDFTVLGRGASSVVYRAFQEDLDRHVAVKVLLADDPDDPARKRFARERAIVGRLGGHPHIVQVFEAAVTADGRPYIVMQLYAGSLGDRIEARGSLAAEEATSIMADIADATQAAHEAGILHRDIKPQNILLSSYGPGLADFGIARAVANLNWSQTLQGFTPLHAAPETFLDEQPPDARSDIWSLGSTLFTALAGRPPFFVSSSEPISKYQLRLEREPIPHIPRADIGPALTDVVNRALAKQPDQRYASAGDMEHALRAILHRNPTIRATIPATVTETTTTRTRDREPTGGAGDNDTGAFVGSRPAGAAPSFMESTGLSAPVVGDGATTTLWRSRSAGRVRPEAVPPSRSRRAHWPLIGGATVAVLVAFLLGAVLLGGGHHGSSPPLKIPTSVAPTPTDSSQAPTDFTAVDHGDSVDLHWDDHSGGTATYIVIYRSVGGPQLSQQPETLTATTIHGLDPTVGYCFRLIAIGKDNNGQHTQSALDTSIRGCVATPATLGG